MFKQLWKPIGILCLLALFGVPAAAENPTIAGYTCPTRTYFQQEQPFTLAEVEAAVGFQHPVLHEIVDQPPNVYARYHFSLACTLYNQMTYIGLVYLLNYDRRPIMRLQILTWDAGQIQLQAVYDVETRIWEPHTTYITPFGDRNFNGLPDFAFGGHNGGKDYQKGSFLLELHEGEVVNITPPELGYTETESGLVYRYGFDDFDDINHDGIPELRDRRFYFPPTFAGGRGVQASDVWWGWDGEAYHQVAVQVSSFDDAFRYDDSADSGWTIEQYMSDFTHVCASVAADTAFLAETNYGGVRHRAFDILLYYATWSDVPTAWANLQPLIDAAATCGEGEGKALFFAAIAEYKIYFEDWHAHVM
jgi:hypothetical protein